MTKASIFRMLSLIGCMALLAAAVLTITACDTDRAPATYTPSTSVDRTELPVIGEGNTAFTLTVKDDTGTESSVIIHTDETTVGDALTALGIIQGEQGPYGLYIKTVNDITVDFDKDGRYWAFYVDGQYATAGIDKTPIVDGASYALVVAT